MKNEQRRITATLKIHDEQIGNLIRTGIEKEQASKMVMQRIKNGELNNEIKKEIKNLKW